jgi:nicotinamidase-related amidase
MLIDTDAFPVKRIAPSETLAPDRTALIIVDMMNAFCDARWLSGGNAERGQWLTAELDVVIPNIRALLDACRQTGALVVHAVNAKWTVEGREVVPYQRGRDYDLFDTPRMSVIEALAPLPGEIVVRKVASSAFTGTGLDFMLRNAGITDVILTGTWGSACVFYTLIQSREFGFSNIYTEDALLFGSDRDKHLFPALVGAYWAKLATTREAIRALGAASE